ncbi:MAG TPA: hypothetical protein VG848_03310 [Acetobacteraceae bacterium]|jgi:hypothetical protein|nr:hypothetical protein [Acetobacteraceae bacterium]
MDKETSFLTGQWPAFAAGSEQRWKALTAANSRLMQGMLSVWQHEMELGQQLLAENLADPKALSEVIAGGADVGAQWSAAHQRFDRAVAAIRRINDEFFDCLFDVAAMANGASEGNGAKTPAAAAGGTQPRTVARTT